MLQLLSFVLLNVLITCIGGLEPVYLKQLTSDTFNDFVQNGDGLKVVYFYSHEFTGFKNFLTEMEKSAAIMRIYDAEFALVDCTKYASTGYCGQDDSESQVYMYRKGRMLIDVSRQALFDINSIVSNVLQVILLMDAPILQTRQEFEQLQASSKGTSDVIFSYQKVLGTYAHRILMEVIYAHRTKYRFGITNEQATVQDLPGFSHFEENGIWVLQCKQVSADFLPCPVIKYSGAVVLENLAQYFRVLSLPFVHDIGRDGDYNPFEDNGLHTVYIFFDENSQLAATYVSNELTNAFFTQLGVIMVNVKEVNAYK